MIFKESWYNKLNFIKCNKSAFQLGVMIIGYFPYHTARIKGIYDKDEHISSLICIPRKFFKELENILSIYKILDNKAVYILESIQAHSENIAIMFKDDFCLIGSWEQVVDYDGTSLTNKSNQDKGAPFDEPRCFNPEPLPLECRECGHQNSENCNTCKVINPQFDGV